MEKRGRGAAIDYTCTDSPLGRMLVARTRTGLCAIAFAETDAELRAELGDRYPEASLSEPAGGLPAETEAVLRWIRGEPGQELPPVDIPGTPFEQRVWAAMCTLPRGGTVDYGTFAASLGMAGAQRAVGAAVGKNPLAVLYPCHRLLARGGGLHRYRWGLERKQWLLEQEGASFTPERPKTGELLFPNLPPDEA